MYSRKVATIKPSVSIFQSELENIAGLASSAEHTEIGGSLFGLHSHNNGIIIMLMTPPGPNAKMGPFYFHDDHKYTKRLCTFLWSNFSIEIVGTQHSHKTDLNKPSDRDIQSTHTITSRNGIKEFSQLILNFDPKETAHSNFAKSNNRFREKVQYFNYSVQKAENIFTKQNKKSQFTHTTHNHIGQVFVNAFLYLNAGKNPPIRCGLRVIPGISPIRQALKLNSINRELATEYPFPISHIKHDAFPYDVDSSCSNHIISERIGKQLVKLKKSVIDDAKVNFEGGYYILSLSISETTTMLIVITLSNDQIRGVYLRENETTIDITKDAIHGPYTKISTIYKRVLREAQNNNLGHRFTRSVGGFFTSGSHPNCQELGNHSQ
ncbi:MAG: hypothetical protein HN381_02065 [Bacteroidetes bacterium]|nr:hypothetical protein [Bacteroidota bacterium]